VVLLAILAGVAGGGYLAYTSLRRDANQLQAQLTTHLELGLHELEGAKDSLKQANTTHDDKLISQAKVHFIKAKLEFLAASQIADSSELLRRVENLPSVGQLASSRHTAVNDISAMGIHLSEAGMDLADLDALLIKPPSSSQQGQGLLLTINQVKAKIDPVKVELAGALKAADAIDMSVLPSGQKASLLKARGTIAQALAAIDQFKALIPMIIEIIGGNGVRTYLIEQVNPAELRAGGGFIGGYSVMRADHGKLDLIRSGSGPEWYQPVRCKVGMSCYVAPPGQIRQWQPEMGWTFVDSNFFPDFPSNAQAGMQLAEGRLGHLDGVIAIDYYAVAKMLEVTGPLAVPGYNITLTSANFIPTVVKYDVLASLSFAPDPSAAILHRAILEAASRPLVDRITKLSSGSWPLMISALNELASSKHLQAYFRDTETQKSMGQFGWTAAMRNPGTTDFMMEVESNLGGTKANYYVTRHFTLELTHDRTNLHHKLTVDIRDDMPYDYRPNEYYQAYMSMFVSDKTTAKAVDLSRYPQGGGTYYPPPAPPPGTQMMGGWINIHGYGHSRVPPVEFHWDTPWLPGHRGEEQIYWQKQPGTGVDKVDVIWNDGHGHTFKTSGDLGQDRVVTIAPSAVTLSPGEVGSFQFPSLSLG
jgi:hypothetical protein